MQIGLTVVGAKAGAMLEDKTLSVSFAYRLTDSDGKVVEPSLKAVRFAIPSFEVGSKAPLHLYVHNPEKEGDTIKAVEGSLVYAPAKVRRARFERTEIRPRLSREGIVLESFRSDDKGHAVRVAFPATTEALRTMGNLDVEVLLLDSEGREHRPTAYQQVMSRGFSFDTTKPGVNNTPASDLGEYRFDRLPDGVTVVAILCTVRERTGESIRIPFKLENVKIDEDTTKV